MSAVPVVDDGALRRPLRLGDLRLLWRRELAAPPHVVGRTMLRLVVGALVLLAVVGVATALLVVDWRRAGMAVAGIADIRPWAALAGVVLLSATAVGMVWLGIRLARSVRLSRWAADNGFEYARRIDDHRWTGMPFRLGRSVTTDVIASERPGLGFVLGRYRWTGEDRRRNGSLLAFTFLQLDLPAEVPHLVLLGRGTGVLAGQGLALRGSQRLSLEGDFDRTFQLFAPAGYERDALYVFAPDLMARVVDAAPGTEIEFVADHVNIYLPGSPRVWRAGRMQALLALVGALQTKLERQTMRYRDDREGVRTSGVALAGQRLRGGIPVRSVVIGVLSIVPTVLVAVWLVTTFTGR